MEPKACPKTHDLVWFEVTKILRNTFYLKNSFIVPEKSFIFPISTNKIFLKKGCDNQENIHHWKYESNPSQKLDWVSTKHF